MRSRIASLIAATLLGVAPASALDRTAFTFTRYDLRIRVTPEKQELSAEGIVTLRNDSKEPQRRAVLQISSTLGWKSIRLGEQPVQWLSQEYTSDIDHTGALQEAIVTLPRDALPGTTIELRIAYEGTIPLDATRLTRIGVPADAAQHTDWDRIGADFTAVRGIGYVAWYPVAIEAVSLSNGDEVFEAIGEWKQRHAESEMQIALTFPNSIQASNVRLRLVSNGLISSYVGVGLGGTARMEYTPIGLRVPSVAIAAYETVTIPITDGGKPLHPVVRSFPGSQAAARDYAAVADGIQPYVSELLSAPRQAMTIVELADSQAVAWESGPVLFTPLAPTDRKSLEVVLAHQLAHAAFESPRPWIDEGVAHLMQGLVRERQDGRAGAVAYMSARLPALVQAEQPAQQPSSPGEPLVTTTNEFFYRTKAMYVWWMLRDMLGDATIQRALAKYRAADDREPAYIQRLLEAESKRQLEWFFDDWVYRDRGLPDFRIATTYTRETVAGAYGITVTVENLGGAGGEVVVTVRVAHGERNTRLLVPAHQKAVTRLLVPATPIEAVVNDGSVPESDMTNNTAAIKVAGSQ